MTVAAKITYSVSAMLVAANIGFVFWYCSENRAWTNVNKGNPTALRQYLAQARNEGNIQEARGFLAAIAAEEFEKINFSDNREKLHKTVSAFMDEFPEFDNDTIERSLFAASSNRYDLCLEYQKMFPRGEHFIAISNRIDQFEDRQWMDLRASKDEKEIKWFSKIAQSEKHRQMAAERLEELAEEQDKKVWDVLRWSDDEDELQKFADSAKTGKYHDLAKERIDALYRDFEYVEDKGTYEAYRKYLELKPNAANAATARFRMLSAALREGRFVSEDELSPYRQELPRSGLYSYYGSSRRIAPLQIKTSAGCNYFVKAVPRGKDAPVCIFVRGGTTVEVDVPLGDYTIKYACGDEWYGEDLLFGSKTSYSKADSTFSFRRTYDGVSGYTLTLYKVQYGNLHTSKIDASSF